MKCSLKITKGEKREWNIKIATKSRETNRKQ